ncbi:MAG: hypothetical protein VB091_03675, partial [Christensenella sp.]|nr:hypothetical protein [Christensenella sp.]
MRRRTVRITPLGYIVLIIIILVMLVGIYFIVWSMRNSDSSVAAASPSIAVGGPTPTPSLAPVSTAAGDTQAPVVTTAPQQSTAPTAASTVTPKQDDTP